MDSGGERQPEGQGTPGLSRLFEDAPGGSREVQSFQ